jgi:hypothetical protein
MGLFAKKKNSNQRQCMIEIKRANAYIYMALHQKHSHPQSLHHPLVAHILKLLILSFEPSYGSQLPAVYFSQSVVPIGVWMEWRKLVTRYVLRC